jgi:hypothetical protein
MYSSRMRRVGTSSQYLWPSCSKGNAIRLHMFLSKFTTVFKNEAVLGCSTGRNCSLMARYRPGNSFSIDWMDGWKHVRLELGQGSSTRTGR